MRREWDVLDGRFDGVLDFVAVATQVVQSSKSIQEEQDANAYD